MLMKTQKQQHILGLIKNKLEKTLATGLWNTIVLTVVALIFAKFNRHYFRFNENQPKQYRSSNRRILH